MEPETLTREEIARRLRAHDITPTLQRVAIARVLFGRQDHWSADRILALVNSDQVRTSKATVYNTLRLFLEKKLVRELIIDPSCVVYDPNMTPHHHFYDVVTGELRDIPADAVAFQHLPHPPAGAVTEGYDVIIRVRPISSE
jgi:Fur family transcriptional regulator, iron response regulator